MKKPPHVTIGTYHRKLSDLVKVLSLLNHTTDWDGFNRSRDLLEQITQDVERFAKTLMEIEDD